MGIIRHKSFTLIEIIIAVGVVGLILPAVFAIFFVIIRQQLVLLSYQTMKQQGDSAQRNIKHILQNRTQYITDSLYTAPDICPLPLTPTPTYSPHLYIADRDGNFVHLYVAPAVPTGVFIIASASADISKTVTNTYNLTSKDVSITGLGFSCHRVNEFTPAIVSATFTVQKSALYRDVQLPYTFNVRLRVY